ncbi:MAG: TetR/AcrR family transcriptional regulator [Prevotellaceae bacterium]|jgi:AcrR family transcriptional regulator|nr:TetR/AcrR family transcriptional regulator [Prevotellaceae bacterium]
MVTSKEKIINTAAKLFIQQGYKGGSTVAIATLSGLSNNSGLFRYFASKEEMYDAVVTKYILNRQAANADFRFDKELSLRRFIDSYIGCIETNTKELYCELDDNKIRLVPANYFIFVQEACRRNKKYKENYIDCSLQTREMWKRVIGNAIERGEVKADSNIDLYADLFHTLYFGSSFVQAAIYNGLPFERLRVLYDFFYDSIRVK